MVAPLGNQFWRARASHGRIFDTPQQLWDCAVEYFEWVEANPLFEDKVFTYQGEAIHAPVAKLRAMTLTGLCLFLDIGRTTFDDYRAREGFAETAQRIAEVIRDQKFQGAAADLLNPSIIARDLGLTDKTDHSGKVAVLLSTDDVNL